MMEIYTIGTSNRKIEEFILLLKKYKIDVVVDVRRFPTSKFECFRKENLKNYLEENGINYEYLGDVLGGFREGGYVKYMESKDFEMGLQKLVEIAKAKRTSIACREKFPWKCHRWMICRKLKEMGFEIIHIIDEKRIYVHKTL